MSATSVRLATPADAGQVADLLRSFFSHEGRVVPELAQNIDTILEHPGRGFFTVADHAGVATTTIHISTGSGCSAVIEEVWVQPSARGAGLGSKLLRASVAECRRRGIESIELRVSPDDQEIGVPDFYAKIGFRHVGRLIYEFADD
jgi:N-acetylglutamate synthase-like GNAT family acetyltransferase